MSFGDQMQTWLIMLLGVVIAVGITLFVLRKMGIIDYAKAAERNAPLNQGLLADPRLAALSAEERQRVLATVRWHPLVILWLFVSIGGFAWVAIGSTGLLNFINAGSRSAFVIAIILFAIVFLGLKLLWRWLIGRAIRQLPRS
jgi:hypothetical protein